MAAKKAWSVCNAKWLPFMLTVGVLAIWQLAVMHHHGSSFLSNGLHSFEMTSHHILHELHRPDRPDTMVKRRLPDVGKVGNGPSTNTSSVNELQALVGSLQSRLAETDAENKKLKTELERSKNKALLGTNTSSSITTKPTEFRVQNPLGYLSNMGEQLFGKNSGKFLAPKNQKAEIKWLPPESRQYYDIVALILSTGTDQDMERMQLAEDTWLSWHGKYTTDMTMTHIFALCQGDPGTDCSGSHCAVNRAHVVVLPCKHSYHALIGKSSAGYRYLVDNFNFKYLLKADVDSIMDVQCVVEKIKKIPEKCRSWGMGLWRIARDSKVFDNRDPGAGKYANPHYKQDTGIDYYPPYMTGWAFVWSGDVARFLGMGGLPHDSMPTWRNTWTIEDAAIGTFVIGLNLCRLPLAGQCPVWTDMQPHHYPLRNLIISHADEEKLAATINVDGDGKIDDYEGPHKDDIPNLGDIENVQAKSIKHCAAKCFLHQNCRSFEFSPTAQKGDAAFNCQLVSKKWPRVGRPYKDFRLYIRMDV